MTPVVIDYDAVAFRAAAAAQKATIKVVHKETGREWEFDNRTALWGHYKTKSGGWIKKQKEKGIEYSPEDFIIEDVVTPEPLANAIQISKRIVERIVKGVGADSYYGYVGPDKCFRNDIATLLPYKGAREGVARPVHLLDVKSYLVKHHAGERVEGIETDDQMAIDTWDAYKRGLDLWGAAIDKDFKGCTGKWYNFVDDTKLIVGTELGELKKLPKKIDGYGRMFKYFQICYGDDVDHYFAACASEVPNGEVAAYNALQGAKTDKEAWERIVKHYKKLYPEPKVIRNWKDEEFEIDWLYVLQEITHMVHMQRWRGDCIDVKSTLDKLGVQYE